MSTSSERVPNATSAFGQVPVPGTTFRQQAERWIDSVSIRKRRPVKPATVYGWQHGLDKWILPNLGHKLLPQVRNGALRQFVEILSAARLAPKTIVNVVTVVKLVVASAVDEEGDQIHPRIWNHEFIQLPLVIKEKQNRPTIGVAEISAMLSMLKGRDAVLVALVAGTGLRIGEALAVRTDDFDPLCRVLQVRRSVWRRREQAPKTLNAIRPVDSRGMLSTSSTRLHKRKRGAPVHDESWTSSGLTQCARRVAASREARRVPRLPPLSFCGTPQGRSARRPHQTVAWSFAKLDRPLRSAITVRRVLSEGMVRESWAGICLGRIGL